jgi:hypothetical protein
MSERHLEWFMMMTGPDEAAERSVSKRWRRQKAVEARQCLNLRNESFAFLQKLTLLQQETTEWVHRPEVVGCAIIHVQIVAWRDGLGELFKVSVDRCKLLS